MGQYITQDDFDDFRQNLKFDKSFIITFTTICFITYYVVLVLLFKEYN